MTRIRLGPVLAAAAVVVALPRYLIAQRFADGQAAPSGPEWLTLIDASAVAWALLEALTLAYVARSVATASGGTRNALLRWSWLIVAACSVVAAPVIVAVGSRQSLTDLLSAASIGHWAWAIVLTASYGLVVMAAFAADAATEQAQIAERVDALDIRRAEPVQAVAAQQVTVNVAQNTPPASQAGSGRGVECHMAIAGQMSTERAVEAALRERPQSSALIAAGIGVSSAAVRRTAAWRNRIKGAS